MDNKSEKYFSKVEELQMCSWLCKLLLLLFFYIKWSTLFVNGESGKLLLLLNFIIKGFFILKSGMQNYVTFFTYFSTVQCTIVLSI